MGRVLLDKEQAVIEFPKTTSYKSISIDKAIELLLQNGEDHKIGYETYDFLAFNQVVKEVNRKQLFCSSYRFRPVKDLILLIETWLKDFHFYIDDNEILATKFGKEDFKFYYKD